MFDGISVFSGLVANIIYNGLSKGFALTKSYLVDELAKKTSEDEGKLNELAEEIIKVNEAKNLEMLSEKYIQKEIESSQNLVSVFQNMDAQKVDQRIIQNHSGTGDNVVGIKNG